MLLRRATHGRVTVDPAALNQYVTLAFVGAASALSVRAFTRNAWAVFSAAARLNGLWGGGGGGGARGGGAYSGRGGGGAGSAAAAGAGGAALVLLLSELTGAYGAPAAGCAYPAALCSVCAVPQTAMGGGSPPSIATLKSPTAAASAQHGNPHSSKHARKNQQTPTHQQQTNNDDDDAAVSSLLLIRKNVPPAHRGAIDAALGGELEFQFFHRWEWVDGVDWADWVDG